MLTSRSADEDILRAQHRREFFVQIGRRDERQHVRGNLAPVRRGAVEGVRRINDEVGIVSQVARHSSGGFAAMIRRDAANDNLRHLLGPQPRVKVRRTVEARVHLLADEQVGSPRDDVLKFVPR